MNSPNQIPLLLALLCIGVGPYAILAGFNKYYCRKHIVKWSPKRIYYLCTFSFWGVSMFLLGVSLFTTKFVVSTFFISGVSYLFMIFTPCSLEIFNQNQALKIIRNLTLAVIGVIFISPLFLKAFDMLLRVFD